jgi:hypothetical protein
MLNLDSRVVGTLSGLLTRLNEGYGISAAEVCEEAGIAAWEVDAAMDGESPRAALRLIAAGLRVMVAEQAA